MPSKYLDQARLKRLERHEYDRGERLDDRQILVAGGTGGLGAAICASLLEAGAALTVVYRDDEARAQKLKRALEERRGARLELLEADIATDRGRAETIDAAGPDFYGAVVCVGDPARVGAAELDLERIERSLRVNYAGPILLARAAAERLKSAGTPGAIVLLSSMQGIAAFPGSLAYSGPKAALVHGARILAQEYGGKSNIRINVVAPGVTETGMALASIAAGKYDVYVEAGIISRFGRPEDVARAVGFFMAPDNYVTGQTLVVDGGLTLLRGAR